ncbi:hypothetical protein CBX96_10015 [Shewanella sp. BC20]|nr:hypothetical protein CBX96_10015 [Shewanella sp. BC20]
MPHATLKTETGENIHVFIADTPWLRLRGLLGRQQLTPAQGLLISPCNSVHTFGMSYPLDIVYLDKHDIVIKIESHLKPYRASACLGATKVLELLAGTTTLKNITKGAALTWHLN